MDRDLLVRILNEQCEIGVFKRGEMYFRSGHVHNRRRRGDKIHARVRGRRNYGVSIRFAADRIAGYCSCPYYSRGQFCKHIIAAALAYREEAGSFVDMEAMRAKIFRQEQKDLAEILAWIVEIHPDLVDDMGMDIRDPENYAAGEVVRAILAELDPLDPREMDGVVRRLKSVHARAEIEHDRGHHAAGRRILYRIVAEGLATDARCETTEIFPTGFLGYIFSHWRAMVERGSTTDPGWDAAEIDRERAALQASPWFEREGLDRVEASPAV